MLFENRHGRFFDPSGKSMEYWGRHVVRAGPKNEKAFRTINVQWIGQWGLFSRCTVPRINKLRVINTLNSSPPRLYQYLV
jgi:hypothetical protein